MARRVTSVSCMETWPLTRTGRRVRHACAACLEHGIVRYAHPRNSQPSVRCTGSSHHLADAWREGREGELHPDLDAVQVTQLRILLLDPLEDCGARGAVHLQCQLRKLIAPLHHTHGDRSRLGGL